MKSDIQSPSVLRKSVAIGFDRSSSFEDHIINENGRAVRFVVEMRPGVGMDHDHVCFRIATTKSVFECDLTRREAEKLRDMLKGGLA